VFPAVIIALLGFGCQGKNGAQNIVRLATTTSVQDTGLLDVLVDAFNKSNQYSVRAVAAGSGQAMQLGRTGEADILLVHSPDDEEQFMAEGYGYMRVNFMHNDFVIYGPASDPAKIKGSANAAAAFRKIAASGALFVSRGDKSGTHNKELKLWEAAAIKPADGNYMEAGQGMAGTLSVANEKNAYCLADRSTYLSMKKSLVLEVVCEGAEALLNRYSLIPVKPGESSKVNSAGAKAFFDFMLSRPAKDLIEKFGLEKYGRQLFFYDYKVQVEDK